jgi:hypothetical protein
MPAKTNDPVPQNSMHASHVILLVLVKDEPVRLHIAGLSLKLFIPYGLSKISEKAEKDRWQMWCILVKSSCLAVLFGDMRVGGGDYGWQKSGSSRDTSFLLGINDERGYLHVEKAARRHKHRGHPGTNKDELCWLRRGLMAGLK